MDHETRDLERSAQTGDLAAEALLLNRRLRTNHLSPAHLRLAAYLGHAASRQLLAAGPPKSPRAIRTGSSRSEPGAPRS